MKIQLLLVLTLFTASLSSAQTTTIPDANFETYLETHDEDGNLVPVGDASSLGDGIDGNNLVLTNRISGVASLDVSGLNISDLTGIEDFTDILLLTCSDNQIATLDLSSNTSLNILECNNNVLTTLSFSAGSIPSITSINCSSNQLSALDVSNMPNLHALIMNDNGVTSLNLADNSNLVQFNCSANSMTTLILPTTSSTLKEIDCYNNVLTGTLDVTSYASSLEILDCAENQYTAVNVSGCTLLETLATNDNNLTTLDVSSCDALSYIDCRNNQLASLDLRNGNNSSITTMDATLNANLDCINVDDVSQAEGMGSWLIDSGVVYSTDCSTLTVNDFNINSILIYPNPSSDIVTISNIQNFNLKHVAIYDISGRIVMEKSFEGLSSNKIDINISTLKDATYFLKINEQSGLSKVFSLIVK